MKLKNYIQTIGLVFLMGAALFFPQKSYSTCNYFVESISYAPVVPGGTEITCSDWNFCAFAMDLPCTDCYKMIPIGFTFNFYDTDYTSLFVGSNGYLTFGSGITFFSPLPIPTFAFPATIFGFFTDLRPGTGGNIFYETIGTAPNRQLVVSFLAVDYFRGGGTVTMQFVLHETTNVIELFIEGWTGDTFVTQGVQNQNGTVAVPIPGRNDVFVVANPTAEEGWRFSPAILTTTTLTSSQNPSKIGTSVTFTATVEGSDMGTPTGTVEFFDGMTSLGSVLLNGAGVAELSTNTLTLGSHDMRAVYSGDVMYCPSEGSLVQEVTEVFPPTNLRFIQAPNIFPTQTEYVNVITGNSPTSGPVPVEYRIYLDSALTKLVGVVKYEGNTFRFEDHNQVKGRFTTYYIVSVDAFGDVSPPAMVTGPSN